MGASPPASANCIPERDREAGLDKAEIFPEAADMLMPGYSVVTPS